MKFQRLCADGHLQTMTTAYAAEVCPLPLRHYLTAYVNLCWIIGQFISAGVLRGLVNRQDVWGWAIFLSIQSNLLSIMQLQNSFRNPMGLANSHYGPDISRSRITLVVRSARLPRPGQAIPPSSCP